MYLFLLKKDKTGNQPFPTSFIVDTYIRNYGKDDIIIANPGYLSTSTNSITDFCNRFYVGNNIVILTPGMNGNRQVGNSTILQEHILNFDLLKKKNNPQTSHLNRSHKRPLDHSKCMAFLEHEDTDEDNLLFEIDENYLYNAKIKAMLIGSSNMSFTTYYNPIADKGECDIFIVNDTVISESDARAILQTLTQLYHNDIYHHVALFKELDSNTTINSLYKSFWSENA